VATQAKLPGRIQRQEFDIVGVTNTGPMAVLTFDGTMGPRRIHLIIFLVTFKAGLFALVLCRKVLPLLDIAESMVVIGKAIAVNPEVVGNHELTSNHDDC
jgi:hypothetical protein